MLLSEKSGHGAPTGYPVGAALTGRHECILSEVGPLSDMTLSVVRMYNPQANKHIIDFYAATVSCPYQHAI